MIARRIENFPALAEAMYLSRYHTERSITSETPSEYGMGVRIQANVAILQRAIELSLR
jgi:hypothetical protein